MNLVNNYKKSKMENISSNEIYDLYAPTVYGKILSIVRKKPIANMILEKVFINALIDKNIPAHEFHTPLISLLNHSREKSYKTIKALIILAECCAGKTLHINDKELNTSSL